MPRHISKKDLFNYILRIRKSSLASRERLGMFINYLNYIREHFFYSKNQLPTEYYTLDYWDIQEIIMDGRVLTYFISKRDKDLKELEKIYFMFLTCDADPNNRTNSPKQCGFYFDLRKKRKKTKRRR
tara:strand:- start:5875 stop:6255 length:381 start_codon:yes stop_codon:yes gene_type:complete